MDTIAIRRITRTGPAFLAIGEHVRQMVEQQAEANG
jgi:hypothetical protein